MLLATSISDVQHKGEGLGVRGWLLLADLATSRFLRLLDVQYKRCPVVVRSTPSDTLQVFVWYVQSTLAETVLGDIELSL